MAAFSDALRRILPRTGRIIKEDGTFWNRADWGYFTERYSLLNQTVNNGASVLSIRDSGVDTSPYYMGLTIPEGRRLVLFFRDMTITQGNYNIDVVHAENGFSGGTVGTKATLKTGAEQLVQTNLYSNVTPSGTITERYLGMVDTGTSIGDARIGGVSGIEGVIQVYTGQPMIRITRLSTDPYRFVLKVIVWEEDDG